MLTPKLIGSHKEENKEKKGKGERKKEKRSRSELDSAQDRLVDERDIL